jgi:hypothetical protein
MTANRTQTPARSQEIRATRPERAPVAVGDALPLRSSAPPRRPPAILPLLIGGVLVLWLLLSVVGRP